MFDGPYSFAIAAGMAATVNPCGFALLPAYLSVFLGTDQRPGGAAAIRRALAVSAALTLGFVTVFGLFGAVVTPLALSLEEHLPWATIVIGLGLVGLGIAMAMGKQVSLRLPKLQAGGRDGTALSMFLFGVSYATASLSCTVGPFLAATTSTFRSSSWVAGFGVFIAYAVGMGVVISILTVALSLARASLVQRVRRAAPVINRVAGLLMVIAGLYVAWYGWFEVRVLRGDTLRDPVVDRAVEVQSWLVRNVVPADPGRAVLLALAIISAVYGVARVRRQGAGTADTDEALTPPATGR